MGSKLIVILSTISLLVVSAQALPQSSSAGLNGKDSSCKLPKGKIGICKNISECPAALSNLRSGVVDGVLRCNDLDPKMVCCPNSQRISATKCLAYTEVLKGKHKGGPFSLLPPEHIEEDPADEEIFCDPQFNPLISGGRDARVGEFPHLVALGYNVANTPWRCGGSLISDEYVLTAAHCINNPSAGKPVKVLLGDITLGISSSNFSRLLVDVAETIIHPGYKPPLTYHDLALVRLKEKVKFSRLLYPACLAQPSDDVLKGITNKNLGTAGWGVLGTGEGQSDTLQTVDLKGYNLKNCDSMYSESPAKDLKFPKGILRSQICAGDKVGRKDTCKGDSGGPLWINKEEKRCVFYMVGITSFGPNHCGDRFPGVYTNILTYIDWIEDNVWKNELQAP